MTVPISISSNPCPGAIPEELNNIDTHGQREPRQLLPGWVSVSIHESRYAALGDVRHPGKINLGDTQSDQLKFERCCRPHYDSLRNMMLVAEGSQDQCHKKNGPPYVGVTQWVKPVYWNLGGLNCSCCSGGYSPLSALFRRSRRYYAIPSFIFCTRSFPTPGPARLLVSALLPPVSFRRASK